ncbi:hypothetical protein 2050HW_00256 [Serratia phage vB_SmaM_ 2050HW]|uniref:DUF7740 domain-containing protein n=1 Tax=Serratia phage vB_SmaM_ 2050HW TaxID=2024252 RepID=A0A289YVX1_9CAUD|nr:hypothetical protein HWB23_gp256 [Serratia phage vB_SmaM_ 2050HW]ATA65591.1 hypothetical protein 2050HW_00256 [Serratia phage vB_SmaM_ 2050HW]UCR74847.1 hypothetical protein [Serratia phage BUCT660]URG14105.1 hypothetical protein [Pectobacterium phage vB_ParM-25]
MSVPSANGTSMDELRCFMDVLMTIAISYKIHNGNPGKVMATAMLVLQRVPYDYPKEVCKAVINEPKNTLAIVNTITMSHFKRPIIIPSPADLKRG